MRASRSGGFSVAERTGRLATALRAASLAALFALLAGGCAGARGPGARPAGGSSNPDVLIAEADTAIAAADAVAARRALDRALAIAPDSAPVHLARGRFFMAIRRYKDAKGELDRAAAIDPSSAEPHYLLGVAYLAAGDKESARSSLARALELDPGHARAREALAGLLESRYEAAGIPADYARLGGHSTISRGELGVILAVELGADPDRVTWRSGEVQRVNWPELDEAWGSRWLRASVMRHWIETFPDGSLHLDDPMTRGQLALVLARLSRESGRWNGARHGTPGAPGTPDSPDTVFADLGARHYLGRAAAEAVRLGLPLRTGKFEPLAAATGDETLRSVRGLAHLLGAVPVVRAEPGNG
jgi:tetratricopeptide (TPR) repeat protein